MIARIPLHDDRPRRIGRQGKPFHLPGRVVQRARGSAGQIQPGHLGVVPTRARVVGGHDGHDDVGTVPIELPDAAIVRAHLGGLARCEVDEEQPASHVAGRSHDRVGVGLGAVDGPGAPIQAVGERIRGQDEQSLTVGGPGEAFGRTPQRGRQHRLPAVAGHRVRKLVPRRDPIRQERQPRAIGRPDGEPIAAVAGRQPLGARGRLRSEHVQIARLERADIGDGGVQREREPRTVRRQGQLRGGPDVEQQFRRGYLEVARHPRILPPHRAPTFAGWPE